MTVYGKCIHTFYIVLKGGFDDTKLKADREAVEHSDRHNMS